MGPANRISSRGSGAPSLTRLVSGGQTGADRAALDVAVELGIPYGGWCPAGGWAEDLTVPPGLLALYPGLTEAASADPAVRTRLNVRDSDATLIVGLEGATSSGTGLTAAAARALGRPLLVTDVDPEGDADAVAAWLRGLPSDIVLNVAGPRESECPGIYEATRRLLRGVLA